MRLDVDTLLIVNAANVLVLAIIVPIIMGQQLSVAAAHARRAFIVQALGWIMLIASGVWPGTWLDRLLSTLSMACLGSANGIMFLALRGWLGVRPFERLLWVSIGLLPIGYGLAFGNYAFRVGWSNFLLTLQVLILVWAVLKPSGGLQGRWRGAMAAVLLIMAIMTFGRGLLGAFFTELYPTFTTPHPFNVAAMLIANITLVTLNVTFLVAWREEAEVKLRGLTVTDALTGLLNRRGWYERATSAVAQAQRHGLPLALLTLDLDWFKHINDSRGHDAGDRALQLFGSVLKSGQRSGDIVARTGGEEFCMLLPLADEATARGLDQRMRALLAQRAPAELGHKLEFSSGLSFLGSDKETLDQLMQRADGALYQAKENGRGRLELA